jgi:hypothetical protein
MSTKANQASLNQKRKNKLSIRDALDAMHVYGWSASVILNYVEQGDLEFDEESFLREIENGTSPTSRSTE